MRELLQLQTWFQEYLFETSDAIQKNIVTTEKVSAERRLDIYKNAYYSRLVEALESTYPILKKYMGTENFEKMGYDYIAAYPSTYRSIRWFGDQLDIFLNKHPDYQSLPYLAELATFEWIMTLVFDSLNENCISIEDIAKIPPEQWEMMQFKMHPSTHFLHTKWNVVTIWEALSEDKKPDEPEEYENSIVWILWRKELTTRYCALPEEEAFALQAIADHKTFGEICEGLCQWQDEENAPLYAASLLKGWIAAGLISCVSI